MTETRTFDLANTDVVRDFAAWTATTPQDAALNVRLVGDTACPSHLVPLVGIADTLVRQGRSITFDALPHSPVAKAIAGFPNLSPGDGLVFGRVWSFDDYAELTKLVNGYVLSLDKSANLAGGVKQGFEWCLNEVMDNVSNHSRPNGSAFGYVMVAFDDGEKRLKASVFDTGIGLRASFEGSKYAPKDDEEAIRLALGRNVTSGNGQGNGLWGLHGLVKMGVSGRLHIRSGEAEYLFAPKDGKESVRRCERCEGFPGTTLVDFEMVCDEPVSLEKVFGSPMMSADLWQEARELPDGTLRLSVAELAGSFGTRESARGLRHIAENAIDNDNKRIILDFADVPSCSSAFADELVGKLVVRYGFARFMGVASVWNLTGLAAALVNSTLVQRLKEAAK